MKSFLHFEMSQVHYELSDFLVVVDLIEGSRCASEYFLLDLIFRETVAELFLTVLTALLLLLVDDEDVLRLELLLLSVLSATRLLGKSSRATSVLSASLYLPQPAPR